MPIADYCRRDVATIDANAAVRTAAMRMDEEAVGCLLVMEGSRMVGIVTDRDLALRTLRGQLDPDATKVGVIAERDLIVVGAQRPVRVAMSLMRRHGLRRLPVFEDRGDFVGLVTWDDLVGVIARELSDVAGTIAAQTPHLPIPASRAVVELATAGGAE